MPCTACTRPDDWGYDNPPPTMDEREKLRQYFLTLPADQQTDGWNVMWEKEITPWDRSEPNPALVEALETKAILTESPFVEGMGEGKKQRKKVLVPGCGGGYDVNLFASYGFDAYGLDASEIAIQKAEQHLREQSKEQKYKLQNIQHGRGEARFLQTDFFKDQFLDDTHAESGRGSGRRFDVIYDYTFLCALPPPMRPKWAKRMSELLNPGGFLICTEYPLGKKPQLGGPPHGLTHSLYEQLLNKPGLEVNYNQDGYVVEDRSLERTDGGLVEVESWVPGKIFEPQKGQIRVSIWTHWKS